MAYSKFLKDLKFGVYQFFYTLMAIPRAWRFMLRHQLWRGLDRYRWVIGSLIGLGALLLIVAGTEIADWLESHRDEQLTAMFVGEDNVFKRWFNDLWESSNDGLLKWATLVLLEVVVYHFMRQSLRIILDRDVANAERFVPFYRAQVRMIQVTIVAAVIEGLVLGAASTIDAALSFVSFDFVQPVVRVVAASYLLGFAIADNYNEQFDLTITQSRRHIWRNYKGIALGLGLPLWLLLKIPLFGTLIGPLLLSVTAAIVLRERTDLHSVGYRMSDKELAKAAKKAAKAERKAARARQ